MSELWKRKQSPTMRFLFRVRAWEFRHLPAIHRISKPSRPDKARRLGFKTKPGFIVYRARIRRGDRKKNIPKGIVWGRQKHHGIHAMKSTRSLQAVVEGRVTRRCPNLRVLNSYWVNQDSTYKWFEVVMVDPILMRDDPRMNWICDTSHKNRALRGLTGAGKKHRGLNNKGNFKARPSRRGDWKRRNTSVWRRYR